MTFGQGLTATMVQLAAAATSIINGGTYYQPRLVDQVIDPDGSVTKKAPAAKVQNVVSAKTADEIKAMMESVVQSGGGTSNKTPGYRIGGKTGTAQIPNPLGGYFDDRDIGSFISAGPLDSPRYVVVVRTDEPHAGGPFAGSAAAAPMAGDIMHWILNYGGVPPKP
jgi:cell division protein FtsI/penicillin-binding protein 2